MGSPNCGIADMSTVIGAPTARPRRAVRDGVVDALRSWPWAILAVALALRLLLLLANGTYAPFGDAKDYDLVARSLVERGTGTSSYFAAFGAPSALRPPAYPYALAGIYEAFGTGYNAARIFGAVLGTVTVLLVWAITRRIWNERLALWAGGVAAVAPTLAWMSSGLVAENLFIPLMLGAVLALLRFRDTPSWKWVLLAGLLLGASVMARSNGLIVVVPLVAAAWGTRRRVRDSAVLLVGLAIALTPWTVRNAVALDTFAPLGTQSGITALGNYNTQALAPGPRHMAWHVPEEIPVVAPYIRQPGSTEPELDKRFRSEALTFAKNHVQYTVVSTVRHGLQLLELAYTSNASPNSYEEQGVPLGFARTTGRAGLFLLLGLAAAAVVMAARRRAWRWDLVWFWSVPVLIFVTIAPLLGPPRYRLPVDPFLCILAAMTLRALWGRVRSERPAAQTTAAEKSGLPSSRVA